jgi:hypothetical protein
MSCWCCLVASLSLSWGAWMNCKKGTQWIATKGESKTTRIMMATVPLRLLRFEKKKKTTDGFFCVWVYYKTWKEHLLPQPPHDHSLARHYIHYSLNSAVKPNSENKDRVPLIVHDQMIDKYKKSKLTIHLGLCLRSRHGRYVKEQLPRYGVLSIGEWLPTFGQAFCCLRLQNLTISKKSRE